MSHSKTPEQVEQFEKRMAVGPLQLRLEGLEQQNRELHQGIAKVKAENERLRAEMRDAMAEMQKAEGAVDEALKVHAQKDAEIERLRGIPRPADLPDDPETLKRIIRGLDVELAGAMAEVKRYKAVCGNCHQHTDEFAKALLGVKAVEGTFKEPECPDGCGATKEAHCWNNSDPVKCIYCGSLECTRMTIHGIEDADGREIPQPMCEKCYQGEGP